jgi:hypothetical protein
MYVYMFFMHECVYVCMYACIHVCMDSPKDVSTNAHWYVHVCTSVCIHMQGIFASLCILISVHTHMHTSSYACILSFKS